MFLFFFFFFFLNTENFEGKNGVCQFVVFFFFYTRHDGYEINRCIRINGILLMVIRDLSTLNRVTRIIRWATIRKTEMEKSKKNWKSIAPIAAVQIFPFLFLLFPLSKQTAPNETFTRPKQLSKRSMATGRLKFAKNKRRGRAGGEALFSIINFSPAYYLASLLRVFFFFFFFSFVSL